MKKVFERTWISPVVTVAFAVIAVTGLLLFFHIKNGPIMALHEWVGWGFVVAGVVHLLLNWRPLLSYVTRRSALLALSTSFLVLAALTVTGAAKQPQHREGRPTSTPPIVTALDANRDGTLDAGEVANAASALMRLDKNGDGQLSPAELQPRSSAEGSHR